MTRRFLIGLMALSIGCNSGGGDGTGTAGNGTAGNAARRAPPGTTGTGGHDGHGRHDRHGRARRARPGTARHRRAAAGTDRDGRHRRHRGRRQTGRGDDRHGGHRRHGRSRRHGGHGRTRGRQAAPPAAAAAATNQSVLERNKNPSRDGHFIQPALTKAAAARWRRHGVQHRGDVQRQRRGLAALPRGRLAAGAFFVPTTGNDVIARNEDGTMKWTRNIGAPATGNIGCASFATTARSGMLATPAIDAKARTIYVAGAIGGGSGVTGQIVSAINADDGTVVRGGR